MNEMICLDEQYCTTRLLSKIKSNCKYKTEYKFCSVLFLPENKERLAEGGLRTNGYFKHSDKIKPLISIVTVVYNGEEFLEDTIQSVINQDYDNVEYIIIDGGSTDKTLDVIKKYDDKIDYWVSEPDKGIYDAMNKGIKLSHGQFIGIINSDDYYQQNILTVIAKAFSVFGVDVVHGDMHRINRINATLQCKRIAKEWKLIFSMSINHPTCFIKKELYDEYLYSTNYKVAADYAYILRAKLKGKKFHYIKKVLTIMRDGGISGIEADLTKKETRMIRNKYLPPHMFILTELIKYGRKIYLIIMALFTIKK